MPKTNSMTKKQIILDYLHSARFTVKDRSLVADLLLITYREGFLNGKKLTDEKTKRIHKKDN